MVLARHRGTALYRMLILGGCALATSACTATVDPQPTSETAPTTTADTLDTAEEIILADFESGEIPGFISANNGSLEIIDSPDGGKALKVSLHSKDHWSANLALVPTSAWDWSGLEDFNFAFDVAGTGTESVQIDLNMADISGDGYTRGFVIPVGPATTVYGKMDGHDQTQADGTAINDFNFPSGLRANPETWEGDDRQVYSFWGKKKLNLDGITSVTFSVSGNLTDREFTIDNIRLRPNPPQDPNFLVGVLDKFGQNAKVDYPTKVRSDEELRAIADAEIASLKGEPLPGRSQFHGWKDGPKHEATGFFRTEKIDGNWWLIDPEGYLYFSTGVDIIRLSNSSTVTGYDFDQELIVERDVNEIISEDDQPLNRVNEEAIPTRTLKSEMRANMFEWLPDYDDELGDHYGYRRDVVAGPLKRGETYSFYSANLERRYGESYENSFMDTWRDVTIKRMIDWGYTSLGNWAEPEFYENTRIPFIAFADINGEFETLTSGFDLWHPLPDPFDPVFYDRAVISAEFVRDQMKASPWCMGIFYDNEQSFGRPDNDQLYYGLVLNTLKESAADKPAKAAFSKILKDKYETIGALNEAWASDIASWEAFDAGVDEGFTTPEQRQDYSNLLYAYGKQYFSTIRKATKSVLPNHLYLGARMADWGRPDEIVRAAAEESDILSFNLYEDGFKPEHWTILDEVDRPTLIGEFSFGADDAGHEHPGIVIAADQEDRGRKFKDYMYSFIESPHFVGVHMFQYMDGPITGRAYDGENYNSGIVSVTDIPYAPLVEASKEVGETLYQRRINSGTAD